MEGNNVEFARLSHLITHSISDEPIVFKVNLCQYLSSCSEKEVKKFTHDPSAFLQELHGSLVNEAKKCISVQDTASLVKYYNLQISITHIPYALGLYRRLGTFCSEDVGKWVIVTGTIVQANQTKTLQKSKLYSCNECGATVRRETHYQTYHRFDWPPPCSNLVQKQKSNSMFAMFYKNLSKRKGPEQPKNASNDSDGNKKMAKCASTKFTPIEQKKICVDYQELRLQQQFKHITAGRLPQSLVVLAEGAVRSNWRPGDDIVVSGLLDYRYKKPGPDQKMQMQLVIVANTIHLLKSPFSRDINDRESIIEQSQQTLSCTIERFHPSERLSKSLQMRNSIVEKFSPNIFGRQAVKLGMLLSLLGGVSLQNEQTKIRGQSHVLLVGEPGTGKSVLLKEAANLAERSFLTNGIGTSSAGLSVSYVKDGGDWSIEPGALVLADNGVCCIDQLTLLSKKDENSLLEAMEQQTVSSAKASVVGRLNARTTLICACNPITPTQKYDPNLDLEVNTGLSIPLLTRFDLILILKDQGNIQEDIAKCDHVLGKFTSQTEETHVSLSHHNFSLKQMLRKCKLYEPELRGGPLLSKYYIEERKNTEKVTTARAFESLCRLSEAHAKLMMRDYTTNFDCLTAIMLTEGLYASTEEEFKAYAQHFSSVYGVDIEECLYE